MPNTSHLQSFVIDILVMTGDVQRKVAGLDLLRDSNLTDFVCLYTYELWLSLCKIVRSSVILLLPLYIMVIFCSMILGER
jgi:hypothetical protein